MLLFVLALCYFLLLGNILLHRYTIHLLVVDIWGVATIGLLEIKLLGMFEYNLCMDIYLHFSLVTI